MFNSKWNKNHKLLWKNSLEQDDDGFSGFQLTLAEDIKCLLNANAIKFTEEVAVYFDYTGDYEYVKLVTIILDELPDSKLWVYHDMAEYVINKEHHIYEEWGYLSPEDLQNRYLNSICEILGMTRYSA